ncbi:MAG: Stp1/IreP family PP2C-type Ser/Thr phosphatase [Clostridia bacterium]|nr:Stp1/IreP family PP2C-type Ser/Thr phosphatase [Clostridia bacterium]MBQ7289077.1 Stp1/IreP family PP2C-type Ser/Thr phosphatase [Clostridia bacterium]
MKIYSRTDKGRVRESNQDSFAALHLSDTAAFAVVCDGMGGANGGNIASAIAVKTLSESFQRNFRNHMTDNSIRMMMESAIVTANSSVLAAAAKNSDYKGMGTTVVAAFIDNGQITLAHLGDSRAYLFTQNQLTLLTHDHSVIQSMIDTGQISESEARYHPKKNVITRALGVHKDIDIEFTTVPFSEGDMLLLCTDGLTNYLEKDRMEFLFANTKPESLTDALVHGANASGGGDNITVVLLSNESMVGESIYG